MKKQDYENKYCYLIDLYHKEKYIWTICVVAVSDKQALNYVKWKCFYRTSIEWCKECGFEFKIKQKDKNFQNWESKKYAIPEKLFFALNDKKKSLSKFVFSKNMIED